METIIERNLNANAIDGSLHYAHNFIIKDFSMARIKLEGSFVTTNKDIDREELSLSMLMSKDEFDKFEFGKSYILTIQKVD